MTPWGFEVVGRQREVEQLCGFGRDRDCNSSAWFNYSVKFLDCDFVIFKRIVVVLLLLCGVLMILVISGRMFVSL